MFLSLDLYIGISGDSLQSEEALKVLKSHLPKDKIVLETDSPY